MAGRSKSAPPAKSKPTSTAKKPVESEEASESPNSQKAPDVSIQDAIVVPTQNAVVVPTQKTVVVPNQHIPVVTVQKIPVVSVPQQNIEDDSGPSCEVTSGPYESLKKKHLCLEEKKKQYFFRILKHLIHDHLSLTYGEWDEESIEGNTYRLIYQKKNCELHILDARGNLQWKDTAATLSVYLKWGECVEEPLTLEDLQRVHNELRFLGLENQKVDACFSLARNEFVKETWEVQRHSMMQIVCEEVNRIFVSGRRHYAITVLYDDTKETAAYYFPRWINKEWVVECRYG